MLSFIYRAAALALLLCAPAAAQNRTGQVAPLPNSGGERVGTAPTASIAPMSLSVPALSAVPIMAAPAAAPAAPLAAALPLAAPAPLPAAAAPENLRTAKAPTGGTRTNQTLSPAAVREKLSTDGRLDEARVAAAYDASASLRGLPKALAEDRPLVEHLRGGAPRQAQQRLAYLQKNHAALHDGSGKAAAELLARRLENAPTAPVVAAHDATVAAAKRMFARREYGLALVAAKRAYDELKAAPLGDLTRLELGRETFALISRIKDRGAPALYGGMGEYKAPELAARVRELQRRDPGAYVGEPLNGEPVRIQCYGDCAVQQAYNHPRLADLTRQLPYPSFLAAVEAANDTKVRKEGMSTMDSRLVLFKLGLDAIRHPAPADAEGLAGLLRDRGALMATVSWHAPKGMGGGDHAVLVQGALRENDEWRFILIDSNYSRPQLYSFRDLQLLSPGDFASLSPLPTDSPYMPKKLRGIADPALRLRAGAHDFVERFAVLRPRVPGWKRAAYGALNALRARLGRDEVEPEPSLERDPNAIPVADLPKEARGLKLPPEALLTGPDGRRYVNRFILERLLKGRG